MTYADENTRGPVDWDTFETLVGLRLPADYKAYIDVYGVGYLNQLFWVRHPTSEDLASLLQAPHQWETPEDEEEYLMTLVEFLLALSTNRLPPRGFTRAGFIRDQILVERYPQSAAADARWAATREPGGG